LERYGAFALGLDMVLFGLSKGKTFWLCSLYIGES
jgi:hypothetical protein